MAWTKTTVNGVLVATETVSLPASATRVSSSEIDFIPLTARTVNRYVTINATASAVAGTNVDIELHGYATSGTAVSTTVYLLKDAPGSISDVTNAAKSQSASFDIQAYPAAYYRLVGLADADETGNTITFTVIVPRV